MSNHAAVCKQTMQWLRSEEQREMMATKRLIHVLCTRVLFNRQDKRTPCVVGPCIKKLSLQSIKIVKELPVLCSWPSFMNYVCSEANVNKWPDKQSCSHAYPKLYGYNHFTSLEQIKVLLGHWLQRGKLKLLKVEEGRHMGENFLKLTMENLMMQWVAENTRTGVKMSQQDWTWYRRRECIQSEKGGTTGKWIWKISRNIVKNWTRNKKSTGQVCFHRVTWDGTQENVPFCEPRERGEQNWVKARCAAAKKKGDNGMTEGK